MNKAQDPWIQNTTLRENILMGSPYEQGRYEAALSACALGPDLAVLPAGDASEIGEKGINLSGARAPPPPLFFFAAWFLEGEAGGQRRAGHCARTLSTSSLSRPLTACPPSAAARTPPRPPRPPSPAGGQKHRVALARAVYAAADVYLLDDPLSAVDAHVGRHLFDRCIRGTLAGKTRVLVTHQLQYLPSADMVVVIADGRISEAGTHAELVARGVDFHKFVADEARADARGGGVWFVGEGRGFGRGGRVRVGV